MPVVTLTDLTIKNLKPVEGKQVTYIDKSLKGFGIRVSETGQMSFVLTYGPNRTRVKLGDVGIVKLSEARSKARTMLAERQLGVHAPTNSPSYQDALDSFLKGVEAKRKPRTHRDYKRLLNRYGFGQERLHDITPNDVAKKLDGLKPSERAHAYAALSIFFRWCVRTNRLQRNPMERTERPPNGTSRHRVLSDDELKALWQACAGMFGDIIKLCLLTGQRRSEIAQLQWSWINGDLITIPQEITKNKREHTFPVGRLALETINKQPRRNDTPYLFPARPHARGKKALFYASWGRDKSTLDKVSGVKGWVIHDLRRTLRTNWAQLRVPREVAEKYINHISGAHSGVDGIYDRYTYLQEMHDAVRVWEDKLRSIIETKSDLS